MGYQSFGGKHHVHVGAANLFIPDEQRTSFFVAPSLVLHYLVEHGYKPPAEFLSAVLACPPTNSSEYFRVIAPSVPTAWLDGSFGFRNALGAAIADENGLMSWPQWEAIEQRVSEAAGHEFHSEALPSAPPKAFGLRFVTPLVELVRSLEEAGDTLGSNGLSAWVDTVVFLGRQVTGGVLLPKP